MRTEKPVYAEIEELLDKVEPPRMALIEQRVGRRALRRTGDGESRSLDC